MIDDFLGKGVKQYGVKFPVSGTFRCAGEDTRAARGTGLGIAGDAGAADSVIPLPTERDRAGGVGVRDLVFRAWPSSARQAVTDVEFTLNMPSTSSREAMFLQELPLSTCLANRLFASAAD